MENKQYSLSEAEKNTKRNKILETTKSSIKGTLEGYDLLFRADDNNMRKNVEFYLNNVLNKDIEDLTKNLKNVISKYKISKIKDYMRDMLMYTFPIHMLIFGWNKFGGTEYLLTNNLVKPEEIAESVSNCTDCFDDTNFSDGIDIVIEYIIVDKALTKEIDKKLKLLNGNYNKSKDCCEYMYSTSLILLPLFSGVYLYNGIK